MITINNLRNLTGNPRTRTLALAAFLLALMLTTMIVDAVEAGLKNFSFNLSESGLFATFWLGFLPLMTVQLRIAKRVPAW